MRIQGKSEIATEECVTSQRSTVLSSPKGLLEGRGQRLEAGERLNSRGRLEGRGQRPSVHMNKVFHSL